MKTRLTVPFLGLAVVFWAPMAQAHEVVVLPGVVGPVGVVSGVNTQGPGTLTVGAQNINTSNEAGGGITTDAANTANIKFTASSTVTGDVGAIGSTFLNIAAGANAATVTFNGQVYSTTFTLTGTGTVNFNRGFVSNTGSTMDFAGDGFINVGAGQTVKAAITNTAGANTGTLTLNANSILDGAVGAASGLKRIVLTNGDALITGEAKATNFDLGTNTLHVAGALTIPVSGTINTTIFSTGLFGHITPVGAATIGTGLKVVVTVTGPIVNGSSFNIVDAASGTTGSTVIVSSNTTRYAFTADPTVAGRVRITTTQIPLAVVVAPVVGVPGAPPAPSPVVPIVVAPVIDALPVTAATTPFLTAITLLPNAQAVAAALAQLAPGTAAFNSPLVGYRTSQRFQTLVSDHLESLTTCSPDGATDQRRRRDRREDTAACPDNGLRSHWWLTGFGDFARQGDVGGFEGYDARTSGAMLAYDHELGDATHAGVAVGYARATVDGQLRSSHAEVKSVQGTAYLAYAPGPWYLNGALAYGSDKYLGTRHVAFPGFDGRTAADYRGHQFTATASTGYRAHVGDGRTNVTPYADLRYTSLSVDGYTETGDPAIALKVASQKYDFLQSGLGLKLSRDMLIPGPKYLRPEAHFGWQHALSGESMSNTANFTSGGPSFTTVGLAPGRDSFDAGAGFVFGMGNRWSIEAAYDQQWRNQNFSAQRMMVTFALHL